MKPATFKSLSGGNVLLKKKEELQTMISKENVRVLSFASNWDRRHLEIKLAEAWDFKRSSSVAPFPPCFCSGSCFILFVTLSFKLIYTKDSWQDKNVCRESCSSVNWSVSAQLKLVDGVDGSDHLNYNVLGFLPDDTKVELPNSALKRPYYTHFWFFDFGLLWSTQTQLTKQ